jgi:branched-chain amino acid transport system permease protein
MRQRGKKRIDQTHEVAILKTSGQWIILGVTILLLVFLPFLLRWSGNVNQLMFINITMITIIAVLGLNIITGMAGQLSLGHAAFVMTGAFITGALTAKAGWPFWAALPAAALITAVIGVIVGAPSLRLKGFYLAVATLAFFLLAQFIIRNMDLFGGIFGLSGIPAPIIGGVRINDDTEWYYLILAFVLILTFFSVNLTRSRLGRAMFAVRDNDTAAASMGIQPYSTKLQAFFIGSLYAGAAGGLLSSYITVVRLDQFSMWDSIWYLGMMMIGGAGSTAGTIMGVIALSLIKQILHMMSMADWVPYFSNNWTYITSGIYGLVIIIFVSFQPYGLIALWKKMRANYKRWPFGY